MFEVKVFANDLAKTYIGRVIADIDEADAWTIRRNLNAMFASQGVNWIAEISNSDTV